MKYKLYSSYAEFDSEYGFAEKAGFQLTKLQIEDVEHFVQLERSLNTYEVGGGKTVVSSTVALMRGCDQKMVIVPPVLITPWSKWLNKVSDGVLVYRGTPKQRQAMDLKNAHWIVMSHAIFRDDHTRLQANAAEELELIVDEAHTLKNPGSVLFKKVQRVCLGL